MNNRITGTQEEIVAAKYLEEQGYCILQKNYRNRFGEIDLVAQDEEYIVFVEVKYRRTVQKGLPEEAVDLKKQRTISKVALHFLMMHNKGVDTPCRFDVVAITGQEIKLYKNAFPYCG